VPDSSHPGRFFPQISSSGTTRAFEPEDMARVLDYESVTQAAMDGNLMHGEDRGHEGIKFPMYHFCLRGGFLFYFDVDDVDEESGNYATYAAPPLGVVPLDKVTVEFPPGGRRVFREHAQTDARNGYELVILHTPQANYEGQIRPPSFLVADSLGHREKWTTALRSRADVGKPTLLRGGYSTMQRSAPSGQPAAAPPPTTAAPKTHSAVVPAEAAAATNGGSSKFADPQLEAAATAAAAATPSSATTTDRNNRNSKKTSAAKKREARIIQEQVMGVSDDAELANAVVEFGVSDFSEREWMANFFQIHNDFDAPAKCRQMELFQIEMKKSLKGAVLEQYEYFVQASGEMTTMGREVSSLKTLIETQVEAMKEMKDIDFSGSLFEDGKEGEDKNNESGVFEPPRLNRRRKGNGKEVDESFESQISSVDDDIPDRVGQGDEMGASQSNMLDENDVPPIQVPEWLEDVEEEITSAVRECRYNDAIDLLTKAKHECLDLVDKHERPTLYRLTKVQLLEIQTIQKNLKDVGKRISDRLEETLRRRNEALKQASKRERTDPSALMAPIVSPCSLNDDGLYLQLLVKLGSTQQAAEAYSARRALLLLETLHEHPISGSGTVDLVIYAAQLSQSFFSCLASSVEGFLDLFLMSQSIPVNGDKHEEMSVGDSSLHSLSSKNVPAGAVSSIVLWCDAELAKFASAFGGTRILANLALSPPPRDGPRQARVLGATEDANGSKERKNAIEVAAQCIDQAFLHASQNLDSVGLPLAPRLSEFIRVRLKGCEAEVAKLLDSRWQHLTIDWSATENGR
jgi:hypothetical protein